MLQFFFDQDSEICMPTCIRKPLNFVLVGDIGAGISEQVVLFKSFNDYRLSGLSYGEV